MGVRNDSMRWLVIGGTSESVDAVRYLLSKNADVTVSAATDMGTALYDGLKVHLWQGYLNLEQFTERMKADAITHVLDASHPYAVEVTRTVKSACQTLGLEYFRYTRQDRMTMASSFPEEGASQQLPEIYQVSDGREAAQLLNQLTGNIALLTGVKTLDIYRDGVDDFQERCYARVLENDASISRCRDIFKEESHWKAEMPPFCVEDNRRFIREAHARILVTKDSGTAGGLPEKLEAARLEKAIVVVIRRPEEADILESLDRLDDYFEVKKKLPKKRLPRLLIGGTSSGCGKTTVTAALLLALTRRHIKVAPYKCGPDYIDPMFHRHITGVPSINLDSIFLAPDKLRELFGWHMQCRDMAVIEGVMGYYDGQSSSDKGSSYDIASMTKTPSVLVVRPEGSALSVAALVRGFQKFREASMIAGVILNGIREGMYPFYRDLIERETGLKVYGFLPEDDGVSLKSRHLGLVTAKEQEGLSEKLEALSALAEKYMDLDGLMALADTAEPLMTGADFSGIQPEGNVRLAVAKDKAFCFYYEDNLELLRRLGVQILPFSPMEDTRLPEHIHGIYLGGGYPEVYAKELSENDEMRASISRAAEKHLPILGECGGYMYLSESIEDMQGNVWPMAGVVPGKCRMTKKLGPFGYVTGTCRKDGLIGRSGACFLAHEFHYSCMDGENTDFLISKAKGRSWQGGTSRSWLYAAYPHLYFYGNPEIAINFVRAMEAAKNDD